MAPDKAARSGNKESLWHSEIYEGEGGCKTPFASCRAARIAKRGLEATPILGTVILDFSPEFLFQFGVRDFEKGWQGIDPKTVGPEVFNSNSHFLQCCDIALDPFRITRW